MAGISIVNWLGEKRTAGTISDIGPSTYDIDIHTIASAAAYEAGDHVTKPYSREFFKDFPIGYVYKIHNRADSEGVKFDMTFAEGRLRLKIESELIYGQGGFARAASDVVAGTGVHDLGSNPLFIFQSNQWQGGDDKCYTGSTIYTNKPGPPDENDISQYYIQSTTYSLDPSDGTITSSFTDQTLSPTKIGTDKAPYIGATNEGDDAESYAEFTGQFDYVDSRMGLSRPTDPCYIIPRHDSSDTNQDLSSFPVIVDSDDSLYVFGPATTSGGLYSVHNYTYEGIETWIPTGNFAKLTASCSFVYLTPDGCKECWYKGLKIQVKITYKVADITRGEINETLGIYMNSIGEYSFHSEVTKNLILPGKNDPRVFQEVELEESSNSFDIPIEAGKVICVDDVVVLSIEPASPPA